MFNTINLEEVKEEIELLRIRASEESSSRSGTDSEHKIWAFLARLLCSLVKLAIYMMHTQGLEKPVQQIQIPIQGGGGGRGYRGDKCVSVSVPQTFAEAFERTMVRPENVGIDLGDQNGDFSVVSDEIAQQQEGEELVDDGYMIPDDQYDDDDGNEPEDYGCDDCEDHEGYGDRDLDDLIID